MLYQWCAQNYDHTISGIIMLKCVHNFGLFYFMAETNCELF